jgi:hypothetical protein
MRRMEAKEEMHVGCLRRVTDEEEKRTGRKCGTLSLGSAAAVQQVQHGHEGSLVARPPNTFFL